MCSVKPTTHDPEEHDRLVVYVQNALGRLKDHDGHLLKVDANERSLSHCFAVHLRGEFSQEWSVDCEYNRDGHLPKKLHGTIRRTSTDNTDGDTVFPDIIVHKRRENTANLLVTSALAKNDPPMLARTGPGGVTLALARRSSRSRRLAR